MWQLPVVGWWLVFVTWDDKSMAGVATASGGMVVGRMNLDSIVMVFLSCLIAFRFLLMAKNHYSFDSYISYQRSNGFWLIL